MTLTKPKVDSAGRVVNPTDLPAFRRYQQIRKLVRKGRTLEEAIDCYDQPRGICQKIVNGVVCGDICIGRSRCCVECLRLERCDRSRLYREEKKDLVEIRCSTCGVKFIGRPLRKFCDSHKPKGRPMGAVGRTAKTSRQITMARNGRKPPTWDRPLPEHLFAAPAASPVKIPKGFKVTFLPSTVPDRRER